MDMNELQPSKPPASKIATVLDDSQYCTTDQIQDNFSGSCSNYLDTYKRHPHETTLQMEGGAMNTKDTYMLTEGRPNQFMKKIRPARLSSVFLAATVVILIAAQVVVLVYFLVIRKEPEPEVNHHTTISKEPLCDQAPGELLVAGKRDHDTSGPTLWRLQRDGEASVVKIPGNAFYLAQDRNTIFYTDGRGSSLWRLYWCVKASHKIASFDAGTDAVAVDPALEKVFVAAGHDIYMLSYSGFERRLLASKKGLYYLGMVADPDQNVLYFTSLHEHTLSMVSYGHLTQGENPKVTVLISSFTSEPRGLFLTGSWLYGILEVGSVWKMNLETKAIDYVVPVPMDGITTWAFSLVVENSTFLYSDGAENTIWRVNNHNSSRSRLQSESLNIQPHGLLSF